MKKRNKQLAKMFRDGCIICKRKSEGDHIKTLGSGGDDCQDNMWALCRFHHVEKGQIGLNKFVKVYGLEEELKKRGFMFCDFMNKWMRLTKEGWDD